MRRERKKYPDTNNRHNQRKNDRNEFPLTTKMIFYVFIRLRSMNANIMKILRKKGVSLSLSLWFCLLLGDAYITKKNGLLFIFGNRWNQAKIFSSSSSLSSFLSFGVVRCVYEKAMRTRTSICFHFCRFFFFFLFFFPLCTQSACVKCYPSSTTKYYHLDEM